MTEEIDWAKVALDYRSTDIPLRELARRHGVSHSGILRRAKRDRWGPRQVAGTPPADVKLPAETGKLPVETGKVTSGNTFAYRDLARTPPPALVSARPSI